MNTSDIVNGFRKALQDLLVPEMKVIQTELKHLNEKYSLLDKRIDQVDKRIELLQQEISHVRITQEKILDKLDID